MAKRVCLEKPPLFEVSKHLKEYKTVIFPVPVHRIILDMLAEPRVREILLK